MESETFNITEASALTGVPYSILYRAVHEGDIPSIRIGQRPPRIRREIVDQILAQGLPKPIASTATPSAPVAVDLTTGGAADTTGSPSISTPEAPHV